MITLAAVALVSLQVSATEPVSKAGAYRVGTATSRIAILPVRCERDEDPSLCRALGESIALEMARDPRIEVVNPHDLEVLVGAASLNELSACTADDCFNTLDFTRVDASYLLAMDLSRIGREARMVVRVVDLKRGTVIDRDEAKAPAKDESAIEDAARALVMSVLVRRGLAQPPAITEAEDEGVRPIFWAGAGAFAAGAIAAGGGGFLGANALLKTGEVSDNASNLSQKQFDANAREARMYGYGADLLFVAGGALALAGGTMMLIGGL
jgi:hypothetical protein